MKYFILFTILLVTTVFTSCNKEPGEGGTSSITGKVKVIDLNSDGDTTATYYALDEDVYIIYGDKNQTYSDKFSTSLDGSYKFDYLTPGTYTVFAYSDCSVCGSSQEAIQKTFTIKNKKEHIILDDIIIIN